MENVLKARITADINDYKSKMAQVEDITENATKEVIQLENALAQAKAEFKSGTITLDQYSKRVNQITNDLTVQRRVLSQTRGGFQQASQGAANANGVFQEFNRTLQDAPFGIIGVGNNLQQLASNFRTLRSQTGSTSQALKLSLGSLVGGINPAILAFTALTTGLTLYSQGAFDGLFANQKLGKSFKELAQETESASANASVETTKLNILRKTIEDETLSREKRFEAIDRLQKKYPEIFGNADKEKLLNGQLIESYELLTKAIIQRAEASLAEKELPDLVRQKELVDSQLQSTKALLENEKELLDTRSRLTRIDQTFSGSDFEQASRRIIDLESKIKTLENTSKGLQINIEGFTESIVSYSEQFEGLLDPINTNLDATPAKVKRVREEFEELNILLERAALERKAAFFEGVESNITVESGRATTQGIITPKLNSEEFEKEAVKVKSVNDTLISSFSTLGGQIAGSLDISNNALRGFVQTVVSNAPKVIQAIIAQSQAQKAASLVNTQNALKEAQGAGIVIAANTAKGLGPIGLAALPILIGGVLALISGAFKKGGSTSGGTSQTFTNVPGREFGGSVIAGKPYIVGEKRPELFVPSTNGIIVPRIDNIGASSASGSAAMGGKLTVEVIGMIENDAIRLANKKGMQKVSRT